MSVDILESAATPRLYREFSRQNTRVHNWLLPPVGVGVLACGIMAINKWVGLVENEFIYLYAPAIASIGIVAEGATFAGILPGLKGSYKRAGEIALEIARVEGRAGQNAKSEISRARGVLKYKRAINQTAEFDLASEAPVPIHPLGWKIKSLFDGFKGLILKAKWASERDAAENPFNSAQHRGELFDSAVELSLLEWTQIENDPQKSDQEKTYAANMFLAIRRLRGTLLSP